MKHTLTPILIAALCLVSACGKKGPLVLIPDKLPLAVNAIEAGQVGTTIFVQWSFPAVAADGKTPFDLRKVERVSLHFSAREWPADSFADKSDTLDRSHLAELAGDEPGRYSLAMPLKAKELNKTYQLAVRYQYAGKKSSLSKILTLASLFPPKPVTGLQVSSETKYVVLRWTRPTQTTNAEPLAKLDGYRVFRKIEGPYPSKGFVDLTPDLVEGESYVDADANHEGHYSYAVATIVNDDVESVMSAPQSIDVKDIFPPDVPCNLLAIVALDHIQVSWQPVKDTDLAHYKVYRRLAQAREWVQLADQVKGNSYKDLEVKKGEDYVYTISAVDQSGNESLMSEPVTVRFIH
jgi:uncharacterized protein